MKPHLSALLAILFVSSASLAAQDEPKPTHHTSFIESRQGNNPDGPDVIAHATVSQDDTLMCTLVGVIDETHQASTACVVKFKDGGQRTLAFKEFMKVSTDSEISLECSGHVPRHCVIEVNDPVNQPPGKLAGR
jgi:hypothetical protein